MQYQCSPGFLNFEDPGSSQAPHFAGSSCNIKLPTQDLQMCHSYWTSLLYLLTELGSSHSYPRIFMFLYWKGILLPGTVPILLGYVPNLSYVLNSCTCFQISFCFKDGHTRMTSTHLDTPGLDTSGWLVLTRKPYMEDTPASLGSTWNGHTWSPGYTWSGHTWTTCTHLDGLKSLDTPGKFGHTWKHWTLEPWNLLWILPDNSPGSPWPMT